MKPYMSALDQRLLDLDLEHRLLDSTYSLKLWYDHTAHLVQKAVRRYRAQSEKLQPDIRSFFDARPARDLPQRETRARSEEGVTNPIVEKQRTQTEITAWTITTQRTSTSVKRKLPVPTRPPPPKQTQTRLVFLHNTKSTSIGITTQTIQQQQQQQDPGCPTASSEAHPTRPGTTRANTSKETTIPRNRRRRSSRPPIL